MTKNSMALNRTLFLEDNLPVLRGLDSESIDLIATDPPFNKGVGAFTGTTKAGQDVEFKDVWNWNDDVQTKWLDEIKEEHGNLYTVIQAANAAAGDDMGAFICWLAVRMLEAHRVLKDTGSIYLHIDHTAHAYVKTMMDAIFGRKQFINEIVWKRATSKKIQARRFGSAHDTILLYSKSDNFVWNTVRLDYDPAYIAKAYRHDDGDGRGPYTVDNMTQSGQRSGESGMDWRGVSMRERGKHWITPTGKGLGDWIVKNVIPNFREIKGTLARLDALDEHGMIHWPKKKGGVPGLKRYLAAVSGPAQTDVVDDIPPLSGGSKERTGYPTQKPLPLYKRMIQASSNPDDIVLDPFAGCATTCVAAEQLGRRWIGIDIREEAEAVVFDRLEREVNKNMAWNDIVRVFMDAPERTDDGEPAAPELFLEPSKPKERRISVPEAREALAKRDGLRCRGCGYVPPYLDFMHVDHKKPKKLKGKESLSNFALLCEPCNRKKSYKLTLRELQDARIADGRMDMDWWESEGKWE